MTDHSIVNWPFCPPSRALGIDSPVPAFRPPKAPASYTRVYTCLPSTATPASIASAHCPPAPVYAPIASSMPSAQSAYSGAWPAGPLRIENDNFLTLTYDPPFLDLKLFLGHPLLAHSVLKSRPPWRKLSSRSN